MSERRVSDGWLRGGGPGRLGWHARHPQYSHSAILTCLHPLPVSSIKVSGGTFSMKNRRRLKTVTGKTKRLVAGLKEVFTMSLSFPRGFMGIVWVPKCPEVPEQCVWGDTTSQRKTAGKCWGYGSLTVPQKRQVGLGMEDALVGVWEWEDKGKFRPRTQREKAMRAGMGQDTGTILTFR